MKVSLKQGQADLTLKAGQPLEVEKLRMLVVKAGFTPTWIRFEAVGWLTIQDGSPFFRVEGTGQVIPLMADAKLEALRKAAGHDGKRVAIVGLIPDGREVTQLERFEIN